MPRICYLLQRGARLGESITAIIALPPSIRNGDPCCAWAFLPTTGRSSCDYDFKQLLDLTLEALRLTQSPVSPAVKRRKSLEQAHKLLCPQDGR